MNTYTAYPFYNEVIHYFLLIFLNCYIFVLTLEIPKKSNFPKYYAVWNEDFQKILPGYMLHFFPLFPGPSSLHSGIQREDTGTG